MSLDPPTKLQEAQERYPVLSAQIHKFTNTIPEPTNENKFSTINQTTVSSVPTTFNFNNTISKYQTDAIIVGSVFVICAFGLWYWKPSFICEKKRKPDNSIEYVPNYKYIMIISIIIAIIAWYVYGNYILK